MPTLRAVHRAERGKTAAVVDGRGDARCADCARELSADGHLDGTDRAPWTAREIDRYYGRRAECADCGERLLDVAGFPTTEDFPNV